MTQDLGQTEEEQSPSIAFEPIGRRSGQMFHNFVRIGSVQGM
jgi:hypothetical protein